MSDQDSAEHVSISETDQDEGSKKAALGIPEPPL